MTTKSTTAKIREFLPLAIILLANIALWAIPDNVTYLIAQNRDILLGRYSVGRFTTMIFLIPVSAALLYLFWPNVTNRKERGFKVLATFVSLLLSLIGIDIAARLILSKRYVRQQDYFFRPPNTVYTGTTRDVPDKAFTYPTNPPAYPDINYTLTTDSRGFRNKTVLDKYDVVVLGDSFAEGSNISDEHVWPALLAQNTGLSVYNLGMSAGYPSTYLETLRKFGLALSPKTVLCMLYEGNDFRDSNYEKDELGKRLSDYFAESPIRLRTQRFLVSHLGSPKDSPHKNTTTQQNDPAGLNEESESPTPGRTGEVPYALSWLPVAVPDGPDAKYYTFKVKALLDHFVQKDKFLRTKGCRRTFDTLREIKNLCASNNARLVVVYAPDKPHVLLPLLQEKVAPQQLRAFMALKQRNLPPAEKLIDVTLSRLDVQESAMQEFCRQHSIDFVSLTTPLRQAVLEGRQAYFTYDQHWTPIGNVVTADTLAKYLNNVATTGPRELSAASVNN
jgi:hypothetical protein